MLGFAILMVSFSMLHNISSTDEVLWASTGYDSSYSVGNVQTLHETRFEMEIPTNDDDDVDDVDGVDEQRVFEAHLENLLKQILTWKPHHCNSIT